MRIIYFTKYVALEALDRTVDVRPREVLSKAPAVV